MLLLSVLRARNNMLCVCVCVCVCVCMGGGGAGPKDIYDNFLGHAL